VIGLVPVVIDCLPSPAQSIFQSLFVFKWQALFRYNVFKTILRHHNLLIYDKVTRKMRQFYENLSNVLQNIKHFMMFCILGPRFFQVF